jgi:hypothetical protein
MRIKSRFAVVLTVACVAALSAWAAVRGGVRGVEQYPDEIEHPETGLPRDADEQTEFQFARLRYMTPFRSGFAFYRWGTDAPKSERQFMQGVRRLTRLHVRSVEQVVNLDDQSTFDYPWMYAVEVGYWYLNDEQAAKLREYLLRGGFLMTDDFHGTPEWMGFMHSMSRVFPDRPVVDIANDDQVFHLIYDLDGKVQVPGLQYLYTGRIAERDGIEPKWRGIYDDRGRLMVLICHNQDYGDAWEWADHPSYPEKYASQAYRLGINGIIYSMTH